MTHFGLTLIGMSYDNKKNVHLYSHLGAFFIRLKELNRVSNSPDWCQFAHSKQFGNDKNSAFKNLIQKGQGLESALPHAN